VDIVLGVLFVGLWCYGLYRLVHHDPLKGVKNLPSDAGSLDDVRTK
jgi:hypothetical protein